MPDIIKVLLLAVLLSVVSCHLGSRSLFHYRATPNTWLQQYKAFQKKRDAETMFKVTSVLWKILINVKYCLSQLMALENVQVKYQYYLFKSIVLISNNEVFRIPGKDKVFSRYFTGSRSRQVSRI